MERNLTLSRPVFCPAVYLFFTLFILIISDILTDTESKLKLVADDCVCFCEIKNTGGTLKQTLMTADNRTNVSILNPGFA